MFVEGQTPGNDLRTAADASIEWDQQTEIEL
jgi:hypothetical protein